MPAHAPKVDIVGKAVVDDGVIAVSLNGRKLELVFTDRETSRTVDGVMYSPFHERGCFKISRPRVGQNVLQVVTMNQLLGATPNPHSIEVQFDESHDAPVVDPARQIRRTHRGIW